MAITTPVSVVCIGEVAVITLDRPKANAIDAPTSVLLYEAVRAAELDAAVRAIVLTGGGERFFSAGWDLKAAVAGEAADADWGPGGFAGITEYTGRRKPLVAAVNGLAIGGGFELMLACDLAVCTHEAQFSAPEATIGVVADAGGVLRLPRRLPRAVAVELLLTGRRMGAEEALRWGLVNDVVPAAALLSSAIGLAERAVTGAPLAVGAVLEVLEATEALDVTDGYALMRSGDLTIYASVASSEDAQEGPLAFAERRPPQWSGR